MRVCLYALLIIGWALWGFAHSQERNSKQYFSGGGSDISSSDRSRAVKAVKKWSSPNGKQGDKKLSEAPFFWDHTKVGRPVFIRIMKNGNLRGKLEVWLENPSTQKFELFKVYRIAFYSGSLGPKMKTGDYQAPEGFYWVNRGRMNPMSSYHLSMDMGYPNIFDKSKKRTGSYLMIHGNTLSIGCFAMTDCSIEQIYTLVDRALVEGQKFVRVHSFPFEMTDGNLKKYQANPHYQFWQNLKKGWDWFEKEKRPPNVTVADGRYQFSNG